ncbi:hypothetical protein Rwratislav_45091 [Rhodococcus wratislaviensis IFP 2016]|nr:hypothetical protein Rwratislav_45091 [Rhodococcus wratislaviensis IFP 2016]
MEIFALFISALVYFFIGIPVSRRWYRRRHGVRGRIYGESVFSSAFWACFIWPLLLLLPHFRDPELCRHPWHIRARVEEQTQYEQFLAAVERDERRRRA